MKKDGWIRLLGVLSLMSVMVMAWALFGNGNKGKFCPPPFESAAQTGMPEAPENLKYRELETQVFRVGLCGEVCVKNGNAEVWFSNHQDNTVWLKLRILDPDGRILGESGLLRPGEYVSWVELQEAEPEISIVLKVMAYEPETYHSAGSIVFHPCTTVE